MRLAGQTVVKLKPGVFSSAGTGNTGITKSFQHQKTEDAQGLDSNPFKNKASHTRKKRRELEENT